MSEPGDVVWADGRAWQRFSGLTWQRKDPECYLISEEWRNEKRWWVRPVLGGIAAQTLANLKQHDDFEWLVKDGIPIVLNALAVYHALDSFADFVAKRDAGAELTAERDALLSRLAEMTAQRDTLAEQLGAEIGNREAAEWQLAKALARSGEIAADLVESERQHDKARHELKSVTARRDELLRDLAIIESEWTRLCAQNNSQRVTIESYQESIKELTTQRDHAVEGVAAMTKLRDAELDDNRITWRQNKALREQIDKARGELDDLQRLVAAAEANEPVLVHPDWRQAEIDALAEERDQLKEKVRMLTLVSRHETLVAEAYRLENIIKETSKERDELNEKLATEKSIREQLQRDLDYAERQYIELRRQFDVVVNDRNILRARCDELERGDRHSCGVKCGQQEERRAVVAWLNKNPQGWARQWSLAGRIERGEHDV